MLQMILGTSGRVSEVDLMRAIYPLNVHRRIERQWAQRIKALNQFRSQFVVGAARTLQYVLNNEGSLVPVAVRAVDQPRLDRPRPRD